MKNILVIGSEGYVGSRLCDTLSANYSLIKVDLGWFGLFDSSILRKDFSNLSEIELENIDAVVLLAGHSSVKMSLNNWTSTFNNNVYNFVSLAKKIKKLKKNIKLIFASSASVYGNTNGETADETYTKKPAINEYDASKLMLEDVAIFEHDIEWYGLRFGTVNGFSRNFRSELMINSMYLASKKGIINVTNKKINRAILDIDDLCRAVEVIIENGSFDKKGFYNLSSFNVTVEDIARHISESERTRIQYGADLLNPYDFKCDSSKFQYVFDFTFKGSAQSILTGIKENFLNIQNIDSRNDPKKYME